MFDVQEETGVEGGSDGGSEGGSEGGSNRSEQGEQSEMYI